MSTLREFVTKWGFDVDDKELKQAETSVKALGETIKTVGAIGLGAAASIFGIVKSVANAGDQAIKTSQKFGIGVEALQEFQYAASLADVESDELNLSLQALSNNSTEAAKGGNNAAKAFGALGVKVTDSSGKLKTNEQLLMELADGFNRLPDGPRKAALAMDVLGKSGTKLLPLFKDGSKGIAELRKEARDLGVVLDENTALAGENFNDSLTRLMAALTGIKNVVGSELLPVLTSLIDETRAYFVANRAEVVENLREVIGSLIVFLKQLFVVTKSAIQVIIGLTRPFGGLQKIISFATKAMVAFLAVQALSTLGSLAIALKGLVTGFTLFGNAALLAQAKALLIPLAIGALIALIALIVEDIYQFFTGGDSVFGLVVEQFKLMIDKFVNWVKGLGDSVLFFLGPVGAIILGIKNLLQWLGVLDGKFSILQKAGELFGKVKGFLGFGSGESTSPTATGSPTGSLAGANPTPGAAPLTNIGGAQSSVNQSNNVKISVNVPPGTPPEKVGPFVQTGVKDGLDGVLRQTSQQTRPRGAF